MFKKNFIWKYKQRGGNIDFFPSVIDNTSYKYIQVDNKYIFSFNVISLPEYIYFLDIIKDIDKTIEYDLSIFLNKQNPLNLLSKLTYTLAVNQSELSTIKKTQRNIDVITKSSTQIEELRRKIQIDNEEVYSINIVISFYSSDYSKIKNLFSSYRAKLYSKGIGVNVTNFRHLEFYLSNLPLNIKNDFFQNNLILTTKSVSNIFPFFTDSIVDVEGIPLGNTKINKRMCMINIFSNKYENSNMCVLGSSGSGKSYFIKLCILRNYFKDRVQIVLDIEDEYSKLCSNLQGVNVFKDTGFNIFQITPNDLLEEDYLTAKINRIIDFLYRVLEIKIDKESLFKEIEQLYKSFGITSDINSVMKKQDENALSIYDEIIDEDKFPTINDYISKTKYKTLKKKLSESLNSTLKPFLLQNKYNSNSKLFVLNLTPFRENETMIEQILEYIKRQLTLEKEIIIYIDELFKYIRFEKILDIVCDMYKSIRKRRASIICVTQDITDFFRYKEGYYANSIINNSSFKVIFKTEFEDSQVLNKVIKVENEVLSALKKGEAFLVINKNNVHIQIHANNFERIILNEDDFSN